MSKANRPRSSARPGQRMEFSFSSFCAVQVPVVSDRLLITIISVDNGKTIAKSSKAAALNGTCQWPDSILQPIRFSRDEVSQEFQECQCKIVVSMGSTKTAILGEVFLNLTNYLSSSDSTAISLPLKRCNSGTVLQLKIQCLGAKKSSGKSWGELSARLADSSPTNGEMDRKSDGFYNIVNKTARSLSENHLEGAYQDESGNRDASFSAPKSRRSSNSGGRKNLSPRDESNDRLHMGRQDAASSYVDHDNMNRGDNSSKDPDTAEETIEELHGEAKMWERRSRKLKIELQTLKNESADKSKQQAELALELSASHSEQNSLRQEIEELKSSLEDVTKRQTILGTPKFGDAIVLQKETIDEVQFLKESNANLTAQLSKTQEANMELVSILQELEETIELQRVEMCKIPQASEVVDHEVSKSELTVQEAAEWARILLLKEEEITMLRGKMNRMLSIENTDGAGPDTIYLELEKENDFLKVKIQELENDFSELTEENLGLIYKLKEVSGVAKGEDPCISISEEMPTAGILTSEVKHVERKCADLELNKLNLRSEFSGLEDKFQKSQDELKERTLELSELREKLLHATELELNLLNLRSEFTGLEEKFQESQDELKERTIELSELREKLLHATELELNLLNLRSEFSGLEDKFQKSQDELKERNLELSELREKLLHSTELEGADTGSSRHYKLRSGEPDDTETDLDVLKRTVVLKEQEVDGLQHCIREMENNISDIQKEKSQLEERLAASLEESSMTSKCLDEVREDLLVLTSSVDSHVSANKVLEAKISELVHTVLLKEQDIDGFHHCKREMENTISDIQKEKSQLEERLAASLEEKLLHSTELEGADTGSSRNYELRSGEPDDTETDLDVLKRTVVLKEQEVDGLQHCIREMENNISDIQKEKSQLEERLAASLEESCMTSKCLDEVRENLLVLTSSVDSHVSANKVLEAKIGELVHTVLLKEQDIDGFHHCKREMENTISDIQKEKSQLEERLAASLEEKLLHSTELEGADTSSSRHYKVRSEEPDDTETDLDVLKRTVLLKEQEVDGLQYCIREMENNISDIQKEKSQLEERLAASLEESCMTSKCLDEAREDLLVLTSSVDSHVSANKVLEAKISELVHTVLLKEQDIDGFHHCKREMENTISDIQKEKSQLEEHLAASLEESSMTSKCLDEMREDLLVLTGSVDSHVSANKVLESKISELMHTVLLKEQDIAGFHHCKREMENTNSDIQKEKSQLEERLAASLLETSMTSKCLDEAREDLLVLTSSVDSHISANKVLEAKISELVHTVLLKEQDMDGLHHCMREMENTISDIQKEKDQLEERLAASLKESCMTSKCLDEVREDLLMLTSSVDSHVSSNKVLETKISELESRKVELESHVSKLEYENIELSQFISELEAQLTSLASENELIKLQMDDSISLMTNINDLVEQQQAEMETAKLELKQQHLESERRLSEVQEDSEALRRSKAKLQATIESVTEECSSLQTLTADLKKQKLELHGRCAHLEQELDQSKRKTADLFNTVEFLEAKISTLQKDITLKEQSLLSELENIFQEHKEHEERINRAHFLLNKIENEKIVEVKNLEREVMSLTAQLSSTDGERESTTLDSIREVSILRADKAKLEANLEDVNAQMRHYESQLEDLRTESKSKINGLTDSLNASKQNEEALTTDVEHIRRLMEAARSNEENLRKTSDELELKYKSSDYEKQQVMEEISGLKIQVNKMASIQDEVSKLLNSLDQATFEKKKLEELLQSLSEECEELKAQKAMLTDKISCIQSTSHDADEENCGKSMEAKLVINQGNDDSANDNGGTPVHEDPDIQSKIHLLETRLTEALEQNKLYRAQLQSPTGEGQSGSRDEKDNKDDSKVAQLESELKEMQDRLLNVSIQYAEVEHQREELVMELKNATAKKGRWF